MTRPGWLPSLWEIAWYWNGLGERDPFCVDLSRPACVGCELVPSVRNEHHLKNRWIACRLERGHLVNACLGGPDTVENLVPLCFMCNRQMPYFGPGQLQEAMGWVLNGGWVSGGVTGTFPRNT